MYLLNHVYDLIYVIRNTRFNRRRQTLKVSHVSVKFITITTAQPYRIFTQFICSSNNLWILQIQRLGSLSYIYKKNLRLQNRILLENVKIN